MQRWSNHLEFASLFHFLLPDVLGNPASGFEDLPNLLGWPETQNFNERTGYVGIVPLFLAAFAIASCRCKFTKFYFFLAAGSILVICGVPPFPALLRALPVVCYMNQMRLLLIVGFSVAVLAGLGWDKLNRITIPRQTRLVAVGFCTVVMATVVCFCIAVHLGLSALDASHWTFLRQQFFMLAGSLIVVVVLAWRPVHWNGWIPTIVCFGWIAVDLLRFGSGYNPAIPRDLYYPRTPAIEWLQTNSPLFRIFGGGAILSPNSAEVFGLNDVRGCDYMSVRRFEELINGHAGEFIFYVNPKTIPQTFPLLNAKYFLSDRELPLDPNLFELVYSKEILIYRFKACLDRALLVYDYQVEPDRAAVLSRVSSTNFDPRKTLLLEDQPSPAQAAIVIHTPSTLATGSARIISYEPDEIEVDASLPRPGYLLLLDTWFPGWSATVNGEAARVYRADYNFRAVSLPAGKSAVHFSYRPQSLQIGIYLCAAGVAALGVACFPAWKRKFHRATMDDEASES